MAFRVYFLEDMLDFAVWADNESSSRYTPNFLAVHVFFFHDPEGLSHFLFSVGKQRKGQIILLLEFLLGFRCIRGDAKQHGAGFLNLFICVAEPASFHRSTRGIRPGIEEEDDGLAA